MATQSLITTVSDSTRHKLLTILGYCTVATAIVLGWEQASLNLIHAQSGIGYWLGIAGTALMLLLLLYPARKRIKALRNMGPVRFWFRMHMTLGILGPLLIVFHSNFKLGSLNSRIALFCTLVVAGSGIVGRYLYAKVHYGLYGRSASLISLRKDVTEFRETESGLTKLVPAISSELSAWEDEQLTQLDGFLAAIGRAVAAGMTTRIRYWRVSSKAKRLIRQAAEQSDIVAAHQKRLTRNANDYLYRRLTLLRKYTQYRAFERLFSLWHVVHYPLFFFLVIAVIVHVLAVHIY